MKAANGRRMPELAHWCRFSEYEIVDGFVRPVADAKFEPIELTEILRSERYLKQGDKERVPSAWEELTKIASHLNGDPDEKKKGNLLTAAGEKRLLAWCAKYGLLGVLLHRTATLISPIIDGCQWSLFRSTTGWEYRQIPPSDGPCVYIHTKEGIQKREIDKEWGRYFPSVPKSEKVSYEYPTPKYEAFWRIYEEPVSEVIQRAFEIRGVMRGLMHETRDEPKSITYKNARHALNELIAPASASLRVGADGALERVWHYPSLLSALGMRITEDLTGGRVLTTCGNPRCGIVFAGERSTVAYCQPSCRTAASKHRAKQQRGAKQ